MWAHWKWKCLLSFLTFGQEVPVQQHEKAQHVLPPKKKYDGTNETKDDKIRVFRNYLLNTGQEELIKASMEKLKEGDIDKFRDIC